MDLDLGAHYYEVSLSYICRTKKNLIKQKIQISNESFVASTTSQFYAWFYWLMGHDELVMFFRFV